MMTRSELKQEKQEQLAATIKNYISSNPYVTTNMVWQSHKHLGSYDKISYTFKAIMEHMVCNRQAERIGSGKYAIPDMSAIPETISRSTSMKLKTLNYDVIIEIIESNLFPGKEASVSLVSKHCKHLASYSIIRDIFHIICGKLVETGRAIKLTNGKYHILKHK